MRNGIKVSRSRYLLSVLCAGLLISGTQGCHHSGNSLQSDAATGSADPAEQEFLQAFLRAHDKKDLEAEEKLVDCDNVTDYSRDFFRRGLQGNLGVRIASARIENIPGPTPYFVVTHNIPPEKFFVVVYDDPRGAIRINYPIGRKDGRYYFAMTGLTNEAIQRNNERLLKDKK